MKILKLFGHQILFEHFFSFRRWGNSAISRNQNRPISVKNCFGLAAQMICKGGWEEGGGGGVVHTRF